jgi:hypothetical protein
MESNVLIVVLPVDIHQQSPYYIDSIRDYINLNACFGSLILVHVTHEATKLLVLYTIILHVN